jgi:hypothetical protein
MAHVLDGSWSSATIDENGDPEKEGKFDLSIDEKTGKIKSGSKHTDPTGAETEVTGQAKGGKFQRITIERGSHTYQGILNPKDDKMLNGLLNLDGVEFDRREDDSADETKRGKREQQQEQAIWVATKP